MHAFVFSSLSICFLLLLVAFELFPNIIISTIDPAFNMDVYDAASSEKSLKIMMAIVAIGSPLVLGYTYFVYKTFKGKVKLDETSY